MIVKILTVKDVSCVTNVPDVPGVIVFLFTARAILDAKNARSAETVWDKDAVSQNVK